MVSLLLKVVLKFTAIISGEQCVMKVSPVLI